MRVIDLLNKIANGEEVPEKIKKYDYVYTYHNGVDYKNEDGGFLFGNSICICSEDLNSTVEIIEEDKEIEELEAVNGSDLVDLQSNSSLIEQNKAVTNLIMYLNMNVVKTNELIKAVNELKKGK